MTETRPPTRREELIVLIEKWRREAEQHRRHGDCYRRGQGWGLQDCADELEQVAASLLRDEGESQHPCEHTFANVELCSKCWRTPADIDGACHHCDEIQPSRRCWWCGRHQSADGAVGASPRSPVTPTPGNNSQGQHSTASVTPTPEAE